MDILFEFDDLIDISSTKLHTKVINGSEDPVFVSFCLS